MKNKLTPFIILPALLVLGACSTVDGWFSSKDDQPPLKGERISVLQLQTQLVPNADAQKTPVVLPDAWINAFWPQAGGYPNHVMGQLALGPTLKKAWSASIGSGGDRRDPLISPPIVADGFVFTLDTAGDVSAFKIANGDKKWRKSSIDKDDQKSGGIGGGLAYAGGKLYVTNGYKTLVCLDAATGNMVWRVMLPTPSQSAPTVMSDKVFVITLDNRLMAYSAADGSTQWNYAGVTETTGLLGSVSPAADTAEVVLPQSSGEIFGLHIENGQVIWEDNLSTVSHTGTLSSISDIRGQPVIDQGQVYAASYSGKMVAINETNGQRLWQKDIGTAEMPWAAGANVYVISNDQQLISLTRDKGDVRWVAQLPRHKGDDKDKAIVWTGPILAGGRLLAASNGGELIEVSPQDGKIIKTTALEGPVFIPPIVASNMLFVVTIKGELVAYR
jgi:outer membrane protein assembly factor BamB